MSDFKRFTNFCAGFAAFSAWIYFFIQFMAYKPSTDVSLVEKLKLFTSGDSLRNYSMYLTLGLCFALSFALSLLFRRLPAVSFLFSLLPMLFTVHQLVSNQLYEYPMMYVTLGALHVAGGLADCVSQDRTHLKHQSALAAFFSTLVAAGVPLYVLQTIRKMTALTETTDLNYFEKVIFYSMPKDADTSIFIKIAILYGIVTLLVLLLREVYFLSAIVSLLSFGYTLYLWHAKLIPVHGALVITAATICTLTQITLMLSCKPRQRKPPIEE
ncbi:MAG: hypothetical protein IJX94_06500 [Clostridia bacterium]|nr:hypothetical protein [Clostridia bacterium]